MSLQDTFHIRTFKAGDLLQYNLHASTEIRYGVVEDDITVLDGADGDRIIRMWRQRIGNYNIKEGAYLRNIHNNFGQIKMRDFVEQNPERFI